MLPKSPCVNMLCLQLGAIQRSGDIRIWCLRFRSWLHAFKRDYEPPLSLLLLNHVYHCLVRLCTSATRQKHHRLKSMRLSLIDWTKTSKSEPNNPFLLIKLIISSICYSNRKLTSAIS
jgi:hypothetical protein